MTAHVIGTDRHTPGTHTATVHTRTGAARPGAATNDGAVVQQAVATKHSRYADVHASPQASFVVLGCETFSRLCEDACSLVREMASLTARETPPLLRGCAQHAWSNRWWSLVGVGVHRAIAESLLRHAGLDLLASAATGTPPPFTEVLLDV